MVLELVNFSLVMIQYPIDLVFLRLKLDVVLVLVLVVKVMLFLVSIADSALVSVLGGIKMKFKAIIFLSVV